MVESRKGLALCHAKTYHIFESKNLGQKKYEVRSTEQTNRVRLCFVLQTHKIFSFKDFIVRLPERQKLRVVCRLDSCPWPLCLTHNISQLACWLKRLKVSLCATRTVRSLHPTSFCANLPKHFFLRNCLCLFVPLCQYIVLPYEGQYLL